MWLLRIRKKPNRIEKKEEIGLRGVSPEKGYAGLTYEQLLVATMKNKLKNDISCKGERTST